MALLVSATNNFITISLDALVDFDCETDLEGFGLARNAPNGLRIRKITFRPSAEGDSVIVRDRQNGPEIFAAIDVLGTWDLLKDEYREDGHIDRGKVMSPYIHANECTISFPHLAFITFEL